MTFSKTQLLTLLASICCLQGIAQINRNFNGEGNNINNPHWGAAGAHFRNMVRNGFADSISAPGGETRPNPRSISDRLGSQTDFTPNEIGLSDFVWGWGQFIDHDINFNDDNTSEANNIPVPKCEPIFDPACTGSVTIRMFRSKSDPATGTSITNPRKHVNDITSYVDASAVYGSDVSRADWLRTHVDGKMKTSAGNLLPWNTIDGEYHSPVDTSAPFMILDGFSLPSKYFEGGDIRVNEQPSLTALHTLWVREHNRLCDELKTQHPTWSDEELFQRARKIVGAQIQAITYEEFLPTIGVILDPYTGYDNTIDPTIMNAFSAAAYRFGHTMINGRLMRYDEQGDLWTFGVMDLRYAFFNPSIVREEGGIEPFFRGLAAQQHQMVDPLIMDDLRNFLFGAPGAGGIDLMAINIERGRERGLPDYNSIRADLSLPPHTSFGSLTTNIDLSNTLSSVYGNDINNIDPWIGFVSEDHLPNCIVGEGLATILKREFTALRDGDRYYYENDPSFTQAEVDSLKGTRLSEVILRNTSIETLQENVFIAVPRNQLMVELVPFPGIMNMKLTAYPNPVQKYFTLVIETSTATSATLNIWDMNGRIVKAEKINLVQGQNELNFELSQQLAKGLYTIALQSERGQGQLRIIKQK